MRVDGKGTEKADRADGVTSRREFTLGAVALLGGCASSSQGRKEKTMYGLIGSMTATPGQRDALSGYLLEGLRDMPGNLSYIVAKDPANADKLWITEVWDSAESHTASLKVPHVQAAIAKARPVIAGMGDRQETIPVGGLGLK
jgi:quinol monooxygenase YgiN